MDTGSARMLVAADGVRAESEALAAEDIGPESAEVAADDVVDPLLSVDDSDPLLSVAQDSKEPDEVIVVLAADGMVPDSQEVAADGVALDSQEPDEGITPELLELPPDSMDVVPDSMEVVPDSLPPGRLYAVAVVSFMRIAKHGTVHTRGSIHALAVVSSTRTTPSAPCSAASRWTARFSWSSTRACCRTTPMHR